MTAVGKGSAKPRAPRPRPAAVPQLTVEPETNGFPVLRLKTSAAPVVAIPRKRVLLFSVDDAEYTMLAEPTFSEGLEYLDLASGQPPERGPAKAFDYAMDLMIGREAYDALRHYDGLTREQFAQVVQVVTDTLLGVAQDPKESSGSEAPGSSG